MAVLNSDGFVQYLKVDLGLIPKGPTVHLRFLEGLYQLVFAAFVEPLIRLLPDFFRCSLRCVFLLAHEPILPCLGAQLSTRTDSREGVSATFDRPRQAEQNATVSLYL